jgi:hypothetical protein
MNLTRGFDLDPSCKLWLPFYAYGAEANKIYDQSGNNNHGTIAGATLSQYGGWGFDGVDDKVNPPGTLANYMSASTGTVLLWTRANAAATVINDFAYLHPALFTDLGTYTQITQGVIAEVDAIWACGFDGIRRSRAISYVPGVWKCIGWVHLGNKLYAYGNGTLEDSTDLGDIGDLSGGIQIGANYDNSVCFNGQIGEVLIFNRALSAVEIRNYYENTRRIYGV